VHVDDAIEVTMPIIIRRWTCPLCDHLLCKYYVKRWEEGVRKRAFSKILA